VPVSYKVLSDATIGTSGAFTDIASGCSSLGLMSGRHSWCSRLSPCSACAAFRVPKVELGAARLFTLLKKSHNKRTGGIKTTDLFLSHHF